MQVILRSRYIRGKGSLRTQTSEIRLRSQAKGRVGVILFRNHYKRPKIKLLANNSTFEWSLYSQLYGSDQDFAVYFQTKDS